MECGVEMCLKSHFEKFSRNFLPHTYAVSRKEICNFIADNELKIEIIAYNIPSVTHSRYIV